MSVNQNNVIIDLLQRAGNPPPNLRAQASQIRPRVIVNNGASMVGLDSAKYSGVIDMIYFFQISDDEREVSDSFTVRNKTLEQILALVEARSDAYYGDMSFVNGSVEISYGNNKVILDPTFKTFRSMEINDNSFIKLPYDVKCNNAIIEHNCVYTALKGVCGKDKSGYTKALKKAKLIKKWTIESFIEFCKNNNINYDIYDRLIISVEKNIQNKHRNTLFAIVSNQHIYPLNAKELGALKKMKFGKFEINSIKFEQNIKRVIDKKDKEEVVKYINCKNTYNSMKREIKPYINKVVIGNVLYSDDETLAKSYKLYKKIGIDFTIGTNYKLTSPLHYITEKFKLHSTFTSFLEGVKPILFNNPKETENVKCIDKNKDYSYILSTMKYIPVISSFTAPKKIPEGHVIYENNFYHVKKIKKNTFNIMRTGWCSGHRLKHFKNECIIDMYIEPDLHENPFIDIIAKMMKEDGHVSKSIINRFVGQMQCKVKHNDMIQYKHLFKTSKEASRFKNVHKVDGYYLTYKTYTPDNKYKKNLLPLAHFVVDKAVNLLLDKMLELKKMDKKVKIVKLNIDSISFVSNEIEYTHLKLNDNIDGWKKEEFKHIDNHRGYNSGEEYQVHKMCEYLNDYKGRDVYLEGSSLILGYAGNGKTTYVINKIIPLIKDSKYIIISSSNKAVSPYRKLDLNCKVMQYWDYNPEQIFMLKHYKYIIIEEIGLFDNKHWELLHNNLSVNTILIGLGDFRQLPPVTREVCPLTNNNVKRMFDKIITKNENWRNNYTVDDYNNMIKGKYEIIKEKHMINKITNNNICYRNKTVDTINEKITKDWKDTFGDLKVKKGGKVILISNKFYKRSLYNKYTFTIKDYGDIISLYDDEMNEHEFTEIEFKNNFKHGYAFTLYYIQGESIDSTDVSFHDMDILKRHGKYLYTALSRIKEPLVKKAVKGFVVDFN